MNQQELERAIGKVWALFKEAAKRSRETDRKMQETSKVVAETSEKVAEMSEKVEKTSEMVDALTGKWERFVEGLVAPGAVRMFKERGIEVSETSTRVERYKNGEKMEIDVLVVNKDYVLAIEAKSTLTVDDVNEHLKKLRRFKEFFPHFADRKVIGAVAGIVIEERSDKYAYRKGLFVIGQTGETVKILNDEKFNPKTW
ncbi:MAG: hypothetical protein J7K81_03635 [Methanophagales archaeon]|nr:hypothetical protein [Methanophagales archaeon]